MVLTIVVVLLVNALPHAGGTVGAVPFIVAAIIAGRLHGRRIGQDVTSSYAWKVAFVVTLAGLALLALGIFAVESMGIVFFRSEVDVATRAKILLIVGALSMGVFRAMFRWGVRTGIESSAAR